MSIIEKHVADLRKQIESANTEARVHDKEAERLRQEAKEKAALIDELSAKRIGKAL